MIVLSSDSEISAVHIISSEKDTRSDNELCMPFHQDFLTLQNGLI